MEFHSSNTECKFNPDSNEADIVCDLCQSMIDFDPKTGWSAPLNTIEHERAIALFGGPSAPASSRWKRLASSLGETEHAGWARLSSDWDDPIKTLPCSESEFESLHQSIVQGFALTSQQQRWMAKGIEFHNGSFFRIMDGRQYLDDVELPSVVSLRSLFPVLASKDFRRGWDLSGLIVGLSCTTPILNANGEGGNFNEILRGIETADSNSRVMMAMLSWLSTRVKIDRLNGDETSPRSGYVSWAYDVRSEVLRRGGRIDRAKLSEAFSNHPAGLFDCYQVPWMQEWERSTEHHLPARTLDRPLRVSEKHISFRVRNKSGRTRLVQVPRQPDLWAILISLSLSPLNSEAGKTLLGLQHNWNIAYIKKDTPSQNMIRSLEFCHEILNGLSDRVYVKNAEVLVFGKLGHCYEIKVTHGQHGAPYIISHFRDFGHGQKHPICIHNGQYHSTVPLGDTIGSVILSMYNDTTATLNIGSLNEVLISNPPFGFPRRPVNEEWIAALNQDALKELTFHQHHWVSDPWYEVRPKPREEIPEAHPGLRGLLARQFRGQQSIEKRDYEWNKRFQEHFEETGTFPYEEVVSRWANQVPPYINNPHSFARGRAYVRAQQYGRWGRMAMRYRHIAMPRNRDDVHEVGDMRDGERRWCEVYARVWEVLISQPLGSDVQIPNDLGEAVEFSDVDLQVTLRNTIERRFVTAISQLLGYVRDGEQHHSVVFIRRDHPRPNARLRLTDLLAETQRRQNVRGAPPRWWNYVDARRAPDAVEWHPWQFHEDLRDTPRQQARQPRLDDDFNGLGELFG